jgi:putative hydrolase of the HAD superfamily
MRRSKLNTGASKVLEKLAPKYRLLLLTAGDEKVQRRKIDYLKLKRHFDRVVIVRKKTVRVFRDLLIREHVRPRDVIMVGNSPRSDILPAQKVGIACVLFLGRTWRFEKSVQIRLDIPKTRDLLRLPAILSRMARKDRPHERE